MKYRAFLGGLLAGSLLASAATVWAVNSRNMAQEEENITIAIEFYNALLNAKDWEKGQSAMKNISLRASTRMLFFAVCCARFFDRAYVGKANTVPPHSRQIARADYTNHH